jgi:hypothetical protein
MRQISIGALQSFSADALFRSGVGGDTVPKSDPLTFVSTQPPRARTADTFAASTGGAIPPSAQLAAP